MTVDGAGHPADETLSAWREGDMAFLDPDRAGAVGAHLEGCAACAGRLAALEALETDLWTLQLADRAPDAPFVAGVIAALPLAPAPVEAAAGGPALAGWWRRQRAAVALALAGLLIMLVTGDALGLLAAWSQDVGAWFTSTVSESESISLLGPSATVGATPEAYLGIIIGAVVLALGAGVFLMRALAAPDGLAPQSARAWGTPSGR
jgi:anti-sigma factor RsiW